MKNNKILGKNLIETTQNINPSSENISPSDNNLSPLCPANDQSLAANTRHLATVATEVPLTPEGVTVLKNGLEELKELTSPLDRLGNGGLSSFPFKGEEAFPKLTQSLEEPKGVFERVHELSKGMLDSEILTKIIQNEGLAKFLNKFSEKCSPENKPHCDLMLDKFLKLTEELSSDKVIQRPEPLGEIGNMTLNELFTKGSECIGPLTQALEDHGVSVNLLGQLFSLIFLYRGVLTTHAVLMRKGLVGNSYLELKMKERLHLERIWLANHRHIAIYAAPLIVGSLFVIKQLTMSPKIRINVNSDTPLQEASQGLSHNPTSNEDAGGGTNKINKGVGLFVFFRKLPKRIGYLFIVIFTFKFINYILGLYSINIWDPYYYKLFSLFSIFIFSCLCLDYLLKLIICYFFINNKNLLDQPINLKLPKIAYEYIEPIRIAMKVNSKYYIRFFLINLLIFLFCLGLVIFTYFLVCYFS